MYKHMKLYTQRHAYFIWEIPMPATYWEQTDSLFLKSRFPSFQWSKYLNGFTENVRKSMWSQSHLECTGILMTANTDVCSICFQTSSRFEQMDLIFFFPFYAQKGDNYKNGAFNKTKGSCLVVFNVLFSVWTDIS